MAGSSVKPCTPLPTCRPAWSRSRRRRSRRPPAWCPAAGPSESDVAGSVVGRPAQDGKVVPTLTATSMLDEPSSGSKITAYLPRAVVATVIGCSFSSLSQNADALMDAEAVEHGFVGIDVELLLHLALDVDLAVRARDIGQAGAADLGLDQLGGQGDARLDEENSPLAPGNRFWFRRMCCSSVTSGGGPSGKKGTLSNRLADGNWRGCAWVAAVHLMCRSAGGNCQSMV